MDSKAINAVSKFRQTNEELQRMAEKMLGRKTESFYAKELSGGLCNAVYLLIADGEKMVLKVAPDESVTMMRHEKDILFTEAKILKVLEERTKIQAPRLIGMDGSCTICKAPYFIMSFMEGTPLMELKEYPDEEQLGEIKRQVGRITKEIASIQAPEFGIPAIPETYTDSNYKFVRTLFKMLLMDASDREILIPGITADGLLSLIDRFQQALDEVTTPYFIHTDTWDGNLMIKDNKLEGMVDFAAILYGDPLMSHDFHDFSKYPRKEFLQGYGKEEFTENERIRIDIYKVWQRLGMIVERGYRNYDDKDLYIWVLDEFDKEVRNLREYI